MQQCADVSCIGAETGAPAMALAQVAKEKVFGGRHLGCTPHCILTNCFQLRGLSGTVSLFFLAKGQPC